MTTLGKSLVVFVLFASVAFMGFAIVAAIGGPNYQTRAAEELPDFAFELTGPTGPWTVKTRSLKDENVGSGKILPEAMTLAQKKKLTELQNEKDEAEKFIPGLEVALKESRELILVDKQAMQATQDVLEQERLAVSAAITQTSAQVVAKSKEVSAQYGLAKLRRQEWILMNNQLQEIRAQKAAALKESRRLQDLLFLAKGNLERAQRRHQLLQDDGATLESY
jgi:hypothetical protein